MMKNMAMSEFQRKQLTPPEEFRGDNTVDTDITKCLFVCLMVSQCCVSCFCLPVSFIVHLTFSTSLGFIVLINYPV